jgi:hypothetical protein
LLQLRLRRRAISAAAEALIRNPNETLMMQALLLKLPPL